MGMFTLDGLSTNLPTQSNDMVLALQLVDIHCHKLNSLKQLVGNLPKENEFFFLETVKSFNAFTFIVFLIKHAGIIDEMHIATYGLNNRILSSVQNWMNKGAILRAHIHISDSIHNRTPKIADMLDMLAKNDQRFTVSYAWTHKKVMCVKIKDNYYVIEGSGNWSENSAQEQYIFTNSKTLYEFRKQSIGTT